MRTAAVAPPPVWPTPGIHGRALTLDLRAVTPIFKGGSTTAQIDEGRPFRVPSIRGALRYWWRATSTLTDVRALRAQEEVLFGGVHNDRPVASAVSVAVLEQRSKPAPRPTNKPYAFGVTGRPPDGDAYGKQLHTDAHSQLRVEWRRDAVEADVKRALYAWLLLGAIGGRSRRGAGSVWWNGAGLEAPVTVDQYVALVSSLVPQRRDAPWPTLGGGALLVGPEFGSAEEAWVEALDGMRDVRASRDVRSTFMRARGPDLLAWKREDYVAFRTPGTFRSARAALGLPIRFQGTMGNFVLNAAGRNRYPSPIHMKVVSLGQHFHPVYVVLRGPMPDALTASNCAARGAVEPSGLQRFLDLAARLPGWTLRDIGGGR